MSLSKTGRVQIVRKKRNNCHERKTNQSLMQMVKWDFNTAKVILSLALKIIYSCHRISNKNNPRVEIPLSTLLLIITKHQFFIAGKKSLEKKLLEETSNL